MYDSARREVVPFEPLRAGHVGMYNCGPTVYDWQHIGNLYAYVVADVARRTFEYAGYEVRQVMNITDVGHIVGDVDEGQDKMELAARRERKDPQQLATMYTERFFEDRRKLNIQAPHVVSKATEHIPQMIALIEALLAKGHAYAAADGVYYDVTTFPGYGTRLNAELPEERQAGARIEVNPNKRHAYDFALWRAAKPGDLQQWDSPWGRGNPGWHIECSAMSMAYLGETFDIHSGGEDHLFPHHECEIAQSEGATGRPFVRYWMHVRFLQVDGRGMHKSIGNTYLVSDLEAKGFDPLAFRLLGLNSGYRKPLNFTWRGLEDEQRRLDRWRSAIAGAALAAKATAPAGDDAVRQAFVAAIGDDFNTPRALAVAEDAVALLSSPERADRSRGLGLLFDIDRVLGLGLESWCEGATAVDDAARALLAERQAARAAGDYARSDKLRDELRERGYLVKDTKEGQRWERVPARTKRNS
ncbi:MAG: cysteine--tRNA ligase [Chloroflexota bacterium]|nr:cysteine--tRNA ligase [Chloroflexota bacterium]